MDRKRFLEQYAKDSGRTVEEMTEEQFDDVGISLRQRIIRNMRNSPSKLILGTLISVIGALGCSKLCIDKIESQKINVVPLHVENFVGNDQEDAVVYYKMFGNGSNNPYNTNIGLAYVKGRMGDKFERNKSCRIHPNRLKDIESPLEHASTLRFGANEVLLYTYPADKGRYVGAGGSEFYLGDFDEDGNLDFMIHNETVKKKYGQNYKPKVFSDIFTRQF